VLNEATDFEGDVFVDTNQFFPGDMTYTTEGFSSVYLEVVGDLDSKGGMKRFDVYNGAFGGLARAASNLIDRENVFLTTGVSREIQAYRKLVRRVLEDEGAEHGIIDRALQPVTIILDAVQRNYEPTAVLEENPLVDRLFHLVPGAVRMRGAPRGIFVSEVDRRILAVSLANGLKERHRQRILTSDKGLILAVQRLYSIVRGDPGKVSSGGLSLNDFASFGLSVGGGS